jgi:hypothetical protein
LSRKATCAARSGFVTKTLGLETTLAGEGTVVKAKGPTAAPAGADEKTPAALVRETHVLEADEEGRASGESDGRGRVARVDETLSPQARDADAGEIVDPCPHERET